MASSHTNAAADVIPISRTRMNLAERALYEITCISNLVKNLDHDDEETAILLPGMMDRIRRLSEAVTSLHTDERVDEEEAKSVWRDIACCYPTPKEVADVMLESVMPLQAEREK